MAQQIGYLRALSHLAISIGLLLALGGCGSDGSGGSGGVGTSGKLESYRYQYRVNGCDTGEQTFSSKESYCNGLTDRKRNNGCAYEVRKRTYESECGGHFVETNTGAEPPIGGVTPPANPPANPPNPPKDPPNPPEDTEPLPDQVLRDLAEAGIVVTFDSKYYRPLPGEPTFHQAKQKMLVTLESVKAQLIANQKYWPNIEIGAWSSYYGERLGRLNLGVTLTQDQLERYLELVLARAAWCNSMGIHLQMGIDVYQGEARANQDLSALAKKVDFLWEQKINLSGLQFAVKEITLDSYSHYFFYKRQLTLNRAEDFEQLLLKYAAYFAPTSSFFAWAEKQGIEVTGTIDTTKTPQVFLDVISQLDRNRRNLSLIAQAQELKQIEIGEYGSDFYHIGVLGKMRVIVDPAKIKENDVYLEALGREYLIQASLGLPIERGPGLGDINAKYLSAIDRLGRFEKRIESKKEKITKISLSNFSSFAYGILYVGSEGTDADLEKVIQSIP